MQCFDKKFEFLRCFSLAFVITIVFAIYWTGLKGGFLFDDFPNLKGLDNYTYLYDFNEAKNFITSGFSGPTGRPIALASFIPQAYAWPSDPFQFKLINLYIHILCGLLLFWATYLLLKSYQHSEEKSTWIALLSAAIWLLHPFFVSTVLYVIQRMAQLSLLFSLLSIIGYLKGRYSLEINNIKAYTVMTVSIGLGTVLATYSKENGALIPLLILIIEFLHPQNCVKPHVCWRIVFLWIPSTAILLLLLKELNFSANPWPQRNFNQIERLYTESRVIVDYLYNLYIPKIELHGLYQDGMIISKGIFEPITTFYAIVFLLTLFISAFYLKSRYPLYALAVLFFFASHLMESTLIGLELYFEHRNYTSAIFLFLPLVTGIYFLTSKFNTKIIILLSLTLIILMSFLTYQRALLWSNTDNLRLYWANNSPDSPRAQYEIAHYLILQNRAIEANQFLKNAMLRLPQSSLLNMQFLLQNVQFRMATNEDFDNAFEKLSKQKFDAQTYQGIRVLTEAVLDSSERKYQLEMLQFLKKIDKLDQANNFYVYWKVSPYLQGQLYLSLGKEKEAFSCFSEAVKRLDNLEAGLKMVAELATFGNNLAALKLLNEVEELYVSKGSKDTIYKDQIGYLKKILIQDL